MVVTSVSPDTADYHKKINTDHWIDDTKLIILHIKNKIKIQPIDALLEVFGFTTFSFNLFSLSI